jgi:hypothetical protein
MRVRGFRYEENAIRGRPTNEAGSAVSRVSMSCQEMPSTCIAGTCPTQGNA